MTVTCKLITADGTAIGKLNLEDTPPLGYTIECEGKEYRIKAGKLLKFDTGAEIKNHVIDGLLLTVELVEEKANA